MLVSDCPCARLCFHRFTHCITLWLFVLASVSPRVLTPLPALLFPRSGRIVGAQMRDTIVAPATMADAAKATAASIEASDAVLAAAGGAGSDE